MQTPGEQIRCNAPSVLINNICFLQENQQAGPCTHNGPVSWVPRKQRVCSRNTPNHGKPEPGSPETQLCRICKKGHPPSISMEARLSRLGWDQESKNPNRDVLHSSLLYLTSDERRPLRTYTTVRGFHECHQKKKTPPPKKGWVAASVPFLLL